MSIGSRIKERREELGITQIELASLLGVSKGAVGNYETDANSPKASILYKLFQILKCDANYLYQDEIDASEETATFGASVVPLKTVPIVGTIACGEPITAVENIDGTAQVATGTHADFALRCKGDSMYPLLNDGDLVFIRQQETVDDGQIAAVLIDGEATLKHLYRQPNGVLLVAENHRYAPITAAEDVRVIGKAVAFQRAI